MNQEICGPSLFARRARVERKRVQAVREFGREKPVDKPVARDPIEPRKPVGNDPHPIMRAPARARAGVSHMAVGFVEDFDEQGIEALCQTRDNSFLHVQRSLSRSKAFDTK